MKRLTHDAREEVLRLLRDDDGWRYRERAISLEYPGMTVTRTGIVWIDGLDSPLPLDWHDRRAIARAFKRRHSAMQAELIRLGQEAKRAKEGAK